MGGLPPDIDEDEITVSFRRFGPLVVDWPHKAESKSYFPPKGYAFLLFQVNVATSITGFKQIVSSFLKHFSNNLKFLPNNFLLFMLVCLLTFLIHINII